VSIFRWVADKVADSTKKDLESLELETQEADAWGEARKKVTSKGLPSFAKNSGFSSMFTNSEDSKRTTGVSFQSRLFEALTETYRDNFGNEEELEEAMRETLTDYVNIYKKDKHGREESIKYVIELYKKWYEKSFGRPAPQGGL